MLVALASVVGWTTVPQTAFGGQFSEIAASVNSARLNGSVLDIDPRRMLGRIWHLPSDSSDTLGLGGGIAYAWDPLLCDRIQPLFREDIFFYTLVGCEDIRQAMSRAFHSWSNNHRFINFIDVTDECQRLHGEIKENCSLVEVWITYVNLEDSLTALDRASGDVNENGVPVALATSTSRYINHRPSCDNVADVQSCRMFRMTNGVELPGPSASFTGYQTFIETYHAKIQFGITSPMCWYLDSAFCSIFHGLKAQFHSPDSARMLVVFVTFAISTLAFAYFKVPSASV